MRAAVSKPDPQTVSSAALRARKPIGKYGADNRADKDTRPYAYAIIIALC